MRLPYATGQKINGLRNKSDLIVWLTQWFDHFLPVPGKVFIVLALLGKKKQQQKNK